MSPIIPLYSVPVLVDNLNKITENVAVSTHENISNPSPMYVQTIILELLRQIGFSSSMVAISPDQLHNDAMSQAEASLLKDAMPVDMLMLASRHFFQRVGGCDITFGLLDLLDPKPIRLRKFLSVLVNFWLFCNNQYGDFNEVKEEVQKRAQLKRDTENRIQDYRRKIEDLRQSKVKEEMKAKKVINDIAELEEELAHACATAEETKRELEPVKARLVEFREYEEVYLKETETLEAIERRLKVLVRADEMKHNLELELQKDNEEFESKMSQQEGYQKRETQLQEQESQIRSFMDMLHVIGSHLKKINVLVDDVKAKESDLDSVRKSIAAKDERLMQVLKEAADLKVDMVSVKGKWNKKKACMESELEDYESKLDVIRQEMSEEDIISSELETSIRQTRAAIENEDRLMKEDIFRLKQIFHQVKSGIATFSMKMEADVEILVQAMERLEKFRP